MIVFNLTIKVQHDIENDWVRWQKEEQIPEIMSTKMFDDCKMYRLLEHDDAEGVTYTLQYFTSSMERYQQYISKFEPAIRNKAFAKWGNRFLGFRTLMQTVQ